MPTTMHLLLALLPGLIMSCQASAVATRSLQQAAPGSPCFIGCFVDAFPSDPTTRALKRWVYNDTVANSPEKCRAVAIQKGYNLFGLEWGRECWLSKAVNTTQATRYGPSSNCTYPCPGDKTKTCGGWFSLDLYTINSCPPPPPSPSPPPLPSPPPTPSPPSPSPSSTGTSSCPTDPTYLPGLVQDAFKGKRLPPSYCPLGGSVSGALGSGADWNPEDWNLKGDYERLHNMTLGITAINLTGTSAPTCWTYNGYFRPAATGLHALVVQADDGAYVMMNTGRGASLAALGAATFYGGLFNQLALSACQYYQMRITACNCQGPYQHSLFIQGPSVYVPGTLPRTAYDPAAGDYFHTAVQQV